MKILMVLMGLEIGGAETHVVELAVALAKRGYEVEVASNGGVYQEELAKFNITHYKLPLHKKTVGSFLKSYFGLKKIISKGRYDVVHAHARIPGFICGLLQQRLKFKFITSAHWVFRTGPLLNRLTNWGQYSVAVSEDIKQYLIDNYQMSAENIAVTVNGINMEKFSPSVTADEIYEEFNLDKNAPTIVYVSRMDTDRSLVAHQLIEAVPKLNSLYPDLQIIIVGGGNDLENVMQEAKTANNSVNRRAVVITGARTDIDKFVAIADLFVGVSRAALEAMSAAKPVIIAGNEGYIGAFHAGVLDEAIETNFCCRGCAPSTTGRLLDDIKVIFDMDGEQLAHLKKYNRKVIAENYSIDKMTDDYVTAYGNLLDIRTDIKFDVMISGYYGYRNIGDDSLLQAIVTNLKDINPDLRIVALSKVPKETEEKYGIESVYRFNIFKISSMLKKTKLLISGGGSLLQDITSTKSLDYYLRIIKMALKNGAKVMVYANGIGPLINPKSRQKVKEVLECVDLITLRDEISLEELKEMGVDNSSCILSADPAYSILPQDGQYEEICKKIGLTDGTKYFMVSLREWDKNGEQFEENVVKLCRYVNARYDLTPVFIPMHKKYDFSICSRIRRQLAFKTVMIKERLTASEIMSIVEKSEFVVGMRLHLLIYSLVVGTPILGISYDPKVDSIIKSHSKNITFDVENTDAMEFTAAVDNIIANRKEIVENNLAVSEVLSKKAYEDAQRAVSML